MNVTINHPSATFTGTITVLETVAVGFTNGTASVDIPPQAIAVFGSMSGFSYYYGAPTPAPPYDANLDTSVNAIVGNSSSATVGTLRAAYVAQFVATSATTAAQVNSWLASVPSRVTARLTGTLTLDAPLVIGSGQRLDATGCTITSSIVQHMIHNTNYASGSTRDSNITIIGGSWTRNAGGVGTGTGTGWGNPGHSIFLRHVDGVVVRDLTITTTGGKYAVALGDVTDYYVGGITAPQAASDTVHITGPATDGVIERIYSPNGNDDVVALTTTDYSSYDDVHGVIDNLTIRDIAGSNTTRMVLIGGSASGTSDGFNLRSLRIDGVVQRGSGATISTGGTATTEQVEDLSIRNVRGGIINLKHPQHGVVTIENAPMVNLSPDTGATTNNVQSLTIRAPKLGTADTAFQMNNTMSQVNTLEIVGAVQGSTATGSCVTIGNGTIGTLRLGQMNYSGTSHAITAGNTTTINQITMDNPVASLAAGRHLVNLSQTCTVSRIAINDANVTAADTSSGILVNAGTAVVKVVTVNRGLLTGIGRCLDVSGGSGTVELHVNDTSLSGCNRIAQVSTQTLLFFYSNLSMASMANQPIRVLGSAPATIRGSGWSGYTASAVARATTEVIHVNARDFPADLSILTKGAGDTVSNTNAGLTPVSGTAAGLVGPCVCDGTNWHNLASASTF
jgi:hypothetical protein